MSKPFEPPKHTQFSNDAIDHIMREVSPNAWKVITVAIRKTYGWHKQSDVISFSQFQELTGIVSRQTLSKAIKEVLTKKILTRRKKGNSYEYELNRDYIVQKSNQDGNRTNTSTETVPEDSTETVHTKESNKKTTKDKKEGASAKTLKANQIPQIILFREVTRRYPAKGSQFTVITSVDKVGDRIGKEATAEDLEPFYREWCDRGYNPVSVKWLSEWAVPGQIPQRTNGNGHKPTQPKGMTVAQSWLEKRQAANG